MDWFREGENCEVVSSAATAAAAAGFDPAWPEGINTEEDVDQESHQPWRGSRSLSALLLLNAMRIT